MPTVLRFDGLRVVIYPNHHRPAHVHVMNASEEAVSILNCPGGPPVLRQNFGFRSSDLTRIVERLQDEIVGLCRQWSEQHGEF